MIFASAALFSACDDVFSPAVENFKEFDQIDSDPNFAAGFLTTTYRALPGYYDGSDVATDDAVTNDKSNGWMKMATATWTSASNPTDKWGTCLGAVQYLNTFLDHVDNVQFMRDPVQNKLRQMRMRGEAYGLRAIFQYYLLRSHAGYTADGKLLGTILSRKFLGTNDNLNLPRLDFKENVDSILVDLDRAEALLPDDYADIDKAELIPAKYSSIVSDPGDYTVVMGNKSRQLINGQIVKAFRARLLLLVASPAFLESTDNWAKAADAAAKVLDVVGGPAGLSATGGTYYTNDDEIAAIKEGSNPAEIIWRENLSKEVNSDESNNYPPSLNGKGSINPTQNLVDAFPAANGYPISDARSEYDAADPYANRDPRLAQYIIYNGATEGPTSKTIYTGSQEGTDDGINAKDNSTRTGYYLKKLLNMKVNCSSTSTTKVNKYTPRLRYTEFFLDYAEAANEAWGPKNDNGHGYSAYDVIKAIRHRAGLTDDTYLDECAESKEKMRSLIRNERRLELCFEGFRFWDLRRWNDIAGLNQTAQGIDWNGSESTLLPAVENRAYQEYMIYGPIPYSETLKYNLLYQNKGWN